MPGHGREDILRAANGVETDWSDRDPEFTRVLNRKIDDTVIEIDGPQHNETTEIDKQRDEILKRREIQTIRIQTKEINDLSDKFIKQMNDLKEIHMCTA